MRYVALTLYEISVAAAEKKVLHFCQDLEIIFMLRKLHTVYKETNHLKVSYLFSTAIFRLPTCHLKVA